MHEFVLHQPTTISDAVDLYTSLNNSKLLAGGTDLILDIKKKKYIVDNLVDLSKIHELKSITENETSIIIGSMVTFSDLQSNNLIKKNYNNLISCSKAMGSPQIRNIATIGGNIINAGAAADIIPCIISLNGELVLNSKNGSRQIACKDYFSHFLNNKILADEILTQVILPKGNSLTGFSKLGKRNSLAISRVSASLSIALEDNIINKFNICLGAVGRFPFNVKQLEEEAIGKSLEWLTSTYPLAILQTQVEESIKGRQTMPFKREAIKGVYKEAILDAIHNVIV